MMRSRMLVVAALGLLTACGGGNDTAQPVDATGAGDTTVATAAVSETTAPPDTALTASDATETSVPAAGTPADGPVDLGSVAVLAPETAGEQGALTVAATDEGRRWATGNSNGTEQVAGDPSLVGYTVLLSDGTTDYTVVVLGGTAVPYFGGGPLTSLSQPTGTVHGVVAETDRQRQAVEAATAVITADGHTVTSGEILAYRVFFPPVEPANSMGQPYPAVEIYADQDANGTALASGGPDAR